MTVNQRPLRYELRDCDQIFYLHIAKAGGTTLTNILAAQFPPDTFLSSDPIGEYLETTPQRVIDGFRFIRAHHNYRIYRYLSRRPVYVTMLRRPLNQVVSHYTHIKHRRQERLAEFAHDYYPDLADPQMMTIVQFAKVPQMSNLQTRMVAGITGKEFAEMDPEYVLNVAKVHLDSFPFFGIMERFDDSLKLLAYTFGWESISEYERLNETPFAKPTITPEIEAVLRAENVLDLAFYDYAVARFEERMQQMEREREA